MNITSKLTDGAIAQILGERIARYRIEAGLRQATLAERAGIGKRTLERVEAGHGAELVTLLRILRVLNAIEGFDKLLPELPPSPIEQLKLRGKQRRRVTYSRSRSEAPTRPSQVRDTPAKPWTWGSPHPTAHPNSTPSTPNPPPAAGSRPTRRQP